jgi:small subunit ribosomal protein S17
VTKVDMEKTRNVKKRLGVVVSDRMDKTVVVEVEVRKRHRLYGKIVLRKTKYYVNDPTNLCKVGNLIAIVDGKPTSKTKRWFVKEIVSNNVADMPTSSNDDDLGLNDTPDDSSEQAEDSELDDQNVDEKEDQLSEEAGDPENKS